MKFNIVKKKYQYVAKLISDDVRIWLDQYDLNASEEVLRRRKNNRKLKNIILSLLGINLPIKTEEVDVLYIFEGIRNKNVMILFDPKSVVIIGSHIEREYAKLNGYNFIWSFPIASSVVINIEREINYPLIKLIEKWNKKFKKFKKIIFFLYEDTQPLGVFLVHLARMLQPIATSVCIQHGIFYKFKYPLRNEGEISDVNLVWNYRQIEIIKCNKLRAHVIGVPYFAKAILVVPTFIVLIGMGTPYVGNSLYEDSISIYHKISILITNILKMKVYYRPHPNELVYPDLIDDLKVKFTLLDFSDKVNILNGPRAIFIGNVSSLLYEAKVADHYTAYLKIDDKIISEVEANFSFDYSELEKLIIWINQIKNKEIFEPIIPKEKTEDYSNKFIEALYKEKLLNESIK
jgi:hypothetical protein